MKAIFLRFSLLLLVLTSSTIVLAQSSKDLKHLDEYYKDAVKDFDIPGMSVAIVKGDEIIFSKGYGYASIEAKKKVDENTLFAIASNSKAFTAMALAQLADQGKIGWKDKVVDHLPYFKAYDPYVTQAMTIEDLLSHRSGLKTFSGDLLWYGTDLSSQEIIEASAKLTPVYGFREKYGYSNIHFIAAGLIVEKISGQSWADYVQEHFLDPLKMDRTLTSTTQIAGTENVATPYYHLDGKAQELEWVNWDNMAPAGALISSAADMSEWIKLMIHLGKYGSDEIVSPKNFNELTQPRIAFPLSNKSQSERPETHFKSYGLGLSLMDYDGVKILSHGGGYDGMISKTCFIPEEELGFVILTNSLNWATGALMNKTIDVLVGKDMKGEDWAAKYLAYFESSQEKAEVKEKEDEKKRGKISKQLLDDEAYLGVYKDEIYGRVTVWMQDDKMRFKMDRTPIFEAELEHWNENIFSFRFNKKLSSLPMGKINFELNMDGEIGSLVIDVPNPDFYFTEFHFIKTDE